MNTQIVKIKKNQIHQDLEIPNETAEKLRGEAQRNPAFSSVCQVFGLRERSRKEITLKTLLVTMHQKGFNYDRGECARVLRFLSTIGIGTLDMDHRGRLRALKDITVALPTIAEIALSNREAAKSVVLTKPHAKPVIRIPMASISLTVSGKTATIELPEDLATKYFVSIMSQKGGSYGNQ